MTTERKRQTHLSDSLFVTPRHGLHHPHPEPTPAEVAYAPRLYNAIVMAGRDGQDIPSSVIGAAPITGPKRPITSPSSHPIHGI